MLLEKARGAGRLSQSILQRVGRMLQLLQRALLLVRLLKHYSNLKY